MKTFITATILFVGLFTSSKGFSQTVSIRGANVITVTNNIIVYVSGTLTGTKGIPITAYTVDVISADNKPTRIATNVASSGGSFNYSGTVASIAGNAPYTVKVTTNRQISNIAAAKACSCK